MERGRRIMGFKLFNKAICAVALLIAVVSVLITVVVNVSSVNAQTTHLTTTNYTSVVSVEKTNNK